MQVKNSIYNKFMMSFDVVFKFQSTCTTSLKGKFCIHSILPSSLIIFDLMTNTLFMPHMKDLMSIDDVVCSSHKFISE